MTTKVRDFLIENGKYDEKYFTTIPCSANFNHFNILSSAQIINKKKELGINNYDFIIGYFGSISNIYHPDQMIKFFQFCKNIQKNTIIIFFSDNFEYLKNLLILII